MKVKIVILVILISYVSFILQVPNLYENFVSSRETDGEPLPSSRPESKEGPTSPAISPPKPERPKIGHTIYVFGYNITEDILKKGFQHFGNIVNISMEIEKKYRTISSVSLHKRNTKSCLLSVQLRVCHLRQDIICRKGHRRGAKTTDYNSKQKLNFVFSDERQHGFRNPVKSITSSTSTSNRTNQRRFIISYLVHYWYKPVVRFLKRAHH